VSEGSGPLVYLSRERARCGEAASIIEAAGGELVAFPAYVFEQTGQWEEVDRALRGERRVDRILFTSARAVEFYAGRRALFEQTGKTARAGLSTDSAGGARFEGGTARVIAIGSKTAAACHEAGMPVSWTAATSDTEGVLAEYGRREKSGLTVLLPRSEAADRMLPDGLAARGAGPVVAPIYRPLLPPVERIRDGLNALARRKPAVCAFTSPLAFTNFTELVARGIGKEKGMLSPSYFDGVRLYALGRTTAARIRELTRHEVVTAAQPSVEELAREIATQISGALHER